MIRKLAAYRMDFRSCLDWNLQIKISEFWRKVLLKPSLISNQVPVKTLFDFFFSFLFQAHIFSFSASSPSLITLWIIKKKNCCWKFSPLFTFSVDFSFFFLPLFPFFPLLVLSYLANQEIRHISSSWFLTWKSLFCPLPIMILQIPETYQVRRFVVHTHGMRHVPQWLYKIRFN